jgi:hypothetical protein
MIMPAVLSHYARVKFYFWNNIIECEREVKQVQISWRLCLVPCLTVLLLVIATVVIFRKGE